MDVILIPLLLLVFIGFPLLQMRKQNKRLREVRDFQAGLSVGDVVKTTSGIHGTISALTDSTVELEIAHGVVTTWDRAAILESVATVSPEATEPNTQEEEA